MLSFQSLLGLSQNTSSHVSHHCTLDLLDWREGTRVSPSRLPVFLQPCPGTPEPLLAVIASGLGTPHGSRKQQSHFTSWYTVAHSGVDDACFTPRRARIFHSVALIFCQFSEVVPGALRSATHKALRSAVSGARRGYVWSLLSAVSLFFLCHQVHGFKGLAMQVPVSSVPNHVARYVLFQSKVLESSHFRISRSPTPQARTTEARVKRQRRTPQSSTKIGPHVSRMVSSSLSCPQYVVSGPQSSMRSHCE